MKQRAKERLSPEIFHIPADAIRKGWYTDKYFVRTREILIKDNNHSNVLMQVFTRKSGVLCGIDEAISILRLCADYPDKLKISALYDGDFIEEGETVMTIEGDYGSFAHLETVYLGVIARGTAVATSVKNVTEAAHDKVVFFFPSRFDHYSVQVSDGYAAFIGGAEGVSTDANGAIWGAEGMGTIPHGMIAAYDGDTVKAAKVFDRVMPKEVYRIALVDFENDCVKTSVEVARELRGSLWGVRLDTASDLWDKSIESKYMNSRGVCPELVWNVRKALDREGFHHVKIVVSGGFNAARTREFIDLGVPFNAVGVGSALFQKRIDFTADIVMVNGKPCAKVGRMFKPNPKLKEVS